MRHVLYFVKSFHLFAGKILYFTLIGMIAMSLFEAVGIVLLIPFINLTGILNIHLEKVSSISWINQVFERLSGNVSLSLILFIYVALMIGQGYFQRKRTIFNARIQHGYMRHLREEMYKSLIQSNWGFFLRKRKTDIINLMVTETTRVSGGIQIFLQFFSSLIFALIQVSIAFWLSARLTLAVLFFGALLLFLSRRFIKKSSFISEETSRLGKLYLSGMSDHFNGIKDIKSNTLEESHLAWVRMLGINIEQNVIEMIKLNTLSKYIFKVVSAVLMAGFVWFCMKVLQVSSAEIMLISVIFTRLWPRISGIQSNLEQIGAFIPSIKQLTDWQDECAKAKELNEGDYLAVNPLEIKNAIECRNVLFRYNSNQPIYALKNINLHIPCNKMSAIVGRSGAGKSTLIDLLMGLNQPEQGQVLIDGVPLTGENLLSLRRAVSYVPQDPFLFNASVRENLLMMEPKANEQELWDALQFSSAADFVQNLPQGLDTLIGDRGVRLSGGERQRLVLARAILRKPSILVLDEATSALDTENEAKIQAAIERLKGKMTIIVIAHRLSTIRSADQVIVLDQGSIVEMGEFGQLANEKRGMFSKLLGSQLEVNGIALHS